MTTIKKNQSALQEALSWAGQKANDLFGGIKQSADTFYNNFSKGYDTFNKQQQQQNTQKNKSLLDFSNEIQSELNTAIRKAPIQIASNIGRGAVNFVNSPFEKIGQEAQKISAKIPKSYTPLQRFSVALPQIADTVGKTFVPNIMGLDENSTPGRFVGDTFGTLTKSFVSGPVSQYNPQKTKFDQLGDWAGTIGTLASPIDAIAGGLINVPFQTILTGLTQGRLISPEEARKAYTSGIEFSAKLGPINKALEFVANPVMDKLQLPKTDAIQNSIKKYIIAKGTEGEGAAWGELLKTIGGRAARKATSGGISMGLYGATEPAANNSERIKNTFDNALQGALFETILGTGGEIMSANTKFEKPKQTNQDVLQETLPTTQQLDNSIVPTKNKQIAQSALPNEQTAPVVNNTSGTQTQISNTGQGTFGWLDNLYTKYMDKFHPLTKLAGDAGRQQEMTNKITGLYGTGSTAKYHLQFELAPILQSVPVEDLRTAAVAMRDLELAGRGIKGSNISDIAGLSSGANSQEKAAIQALSNLKSRVGDEKMKQIGEALQQLYSYQDNLVKEYLVGTGIMSNKQYNAMKAKNQFYVPFQRVMDSVDEMLGTAPPKTNIGNVSKQNVIRGIKGGDAQIHDPFESIIKNTVNIVALAKRQEVAKTIVDLKSSLPEGIIKEFNGKSSAGLPIISYMKDGKAQKYIVPKEVYEAAKGLSTSQFGAIMKILSFGTRAFRTSTTSLNPEFLPTNVIRDLQSAYVNVGLNPLAFVKGFAHMANQDQVYKDFLKSGGEASTRISLDRSVLAKSVDQYAKNGITIKKPSDILNYIENAAAYTEIPTRIAAFEKVYNESIKNGLSVEEARARGAYAAQEATVNFARTGTNTKNFNALYAFINARAQGLDRLVRTVRSDPKGAFVRLGVVSATPAFVLYAWNRNFKSYSNPQIVSPSDKSNNFIVMLSDTPIDKMGGAYYLKIPKGDVGKIANPIEEFLAYADGKGGDVSRGIGTALAGFSPVDLTTPNRQTGGNDFNAIGVFSPTTLRPIIESTLNKDSFTGNQIVPDYKTNYPAEYQYNSSTSPLFRGISNKIKDLSGIGISPAQMQHIAEGYGSGLTRVAEMSLNRFAPSDVQKTYTGSTINQTPILRRFLGGPQRSADEYMLGQDKTANSYNTKINEIKAGINRGDLPMDIGVKQIQDLQDKRDQILNKANQDVLGASATGGSSSSGTSKDGQMYYMENGKLQTIDLSQFDTKATGIKKYEQQAKKYSVARDVFDATGLTDQQKKQIYDKLGLKEGDVQYDAMASKTTDIKSNYLTEFLSSYDHDAMIQALIEGRAESISGKMLTNDATIDAIQENGLITEEEAKYIKKFKFSSSGKDLSKSTSNKVSYKISVPKTSAIKATPLKLSAPNFSTKLKVSKSKTNQFRKIKLQQPTLPTLKTPKISLNIKPAVRSLSGLGKAT